MQSDDTTGVAVGNVDAAARLEQRLKQIDVQPWKFRRCVVRVLLVADGILGFDETDFGLAEFIWDCRAGR